MPPTTPVNGFPRVAVVMARLVVASEDRGVRPFIVWLNDGQNMCDGITSKYAYLLTLIIDITRLMRGKKETAQPSWLAAGRPRDNELQPRPPTSLSAPRLSRQAQEHASQLPLRHLARDRRYPGIVNGYGPRDET